MKNYKLKKSLKKLKILVDIYVYIFKMIGFPSSNHYKNWNVKSQNLYSQCTILWRIDVELLFFSHRKNFFVILLTDGEPFMHRNIFSLDYIHKSENPHKAKKCAYLFVFCKVDAKLQKNLKGSLLFHITDLLLYV